MIYVFAIFTKHKVKLVRSVGISSVGVLESERVESVIDQVLTHVALRADQREQVIRNSLRGSPFAKVAWPVEAMADDVSEALARIQMPTLVISGTQNLVDPVAEVGGILRGRFRRFDSK